MERIAGAFNEIISDLGLKKAFSVEQLRRQWKDIVGPSIALHTTPAAFRNGRLTIHVDSPEWLHELQYHHSGIAKKLAPLGFEKVRFILGPVGKKEECSTPSRQQRILRPEDRRFAESVASPVSDTVLRERIRRAMEESLKHKR